MPSLSAQSLSARWVGECPPHVQKLTRAYNIKITPWSYLNQKAISPLTEIPNHLFMAPDPNGKFPAGFSVIPIVKNSQSRVLVLLTESSNKRGFQLPTEFLGLPYEEVLTSAKDIQSFLEGRFKTSDELRHQLKGLFEKQRVDLMQFLSIVDSYDHPLLVVNEFGRIILKNTASHALFKGVYFPMTLSDLFPMGRFFLQIDGDQRFLTLTQVLKKHIHPILFKGESEYQVFIQRLRMSLYGQAYILVFKDRGKFEVEETNTFFLDSRVVMSSMFHELRSPVTSIGLGLEVLKEQELNEELKQDVLYCMDAYSRMKALSADLPQFFSWEDKGLKPKLIRIDTLLEDLCVVLNVQLKRRLKLNEKKQLRLMGEKSTPKIIVVRSSLFQAFQELVHFLLEFCSVDPVAQGVALKSEIKGNKFYIDLEVSGGDMGIIRSYHRAFSDQEETIHHKSLGLREAVRHAYLSRISDLFQSAGFRLWIFNRKHEHTFRLEYEKLLRPLAAKRQMLSH